MKKHAFLLILLLSFVTAISFSQIFNDGDVAQQYAQWLQQAINEERWSEASAAVPRVGGFSNVSSDIAYLCAYIHSQTSKDRMAIIAFLDIALDVNRWVNYNENHALVLKAEQLIAMRNYMSAIALLDQIGERAGTVSAEAAMARLLAFRGLAVTTGDAHALALFRSHVVSAMDRHPRDPRPLRIFLEYAHGKNPESTELTKNDQDLLELVLRRLPFLLESDPELAWLAAPFMSNPDDAQRYVSAYRAGGIPSVQNRDFYPSAGSIAIALNFGLIDDNTAVEELFSGNRGSNSPLPYGIAANGNPVIEKEMITKVYSLLRSEEGRELFTQKLLSFSGLIISDDDHDGFIDSLAYYKSGIVTEFKFDRNQTNIFDLQIVFSANGLPAEAVVPVSGQPSPLLAAPLSIVWERYPHVEKAVFLLEQFSFRPADFQFAPVSFIVLGGSRKQSGLAYPVLSAQMEVSRRSMISFCSSITRPSIEFEGAIERIYFEKGLPAQATETKDGKTISVTEFNNGYPVIQYIDFDLDGRMETIRRFRRPGPDFPWPEPDARFNYRVLIASTESDMTGSGRYGTGEVYLQDGSVVYTWDMDGSGEMNYSETDTGNQ